MHINLLRFLSAIFFCTFAITSQNSHAQNSLSTAEQALLQAKELGAEWLILDETIEDSTISLSEILAKAKKAISDGNTEEGDRLAKIVLRYSNLSINQYNWNKTHTTTYSKPKDNIAALPELPDDYLAVGISKTRGYQDITHRGQIIRIQRIQDVSNRLSDDFTLTSRPCPPFCIQPAQVAEGVRSVAELEILAFINNEKSSPGYLIDARLPDVYGLETIPGAANLPFIMLSNSADKILPALGATKQGDSWDFSNAKSLILFCNGPWCQQSPRAIKILLKIGYPASKLSHYRGGLQAWKSFGLTTVQTLSYNVTDPN